MAIIEKITSEEIEKELERSKSKKICSVCKEELPKDFFRVRKYHPKCAKIMVRLQSRKYKPKKTPEQKQRNRLRSMVKFQMEHPSCSYQQSGKCVKKSIEIEGINIIVGGKICPFRKNKDKCPNFKPKYPEIYKQLIKLRGDE